jgi:NAD(P)-dependent dehydrogenase (short-subunit alcohol dehydrogenase family)
MRFDFTNKVVIVTGGASGMGRATAEMFARCSAKVVIGDLNPAAEDVVGAIKSAGGDAVFVKTDVSVAEQVENLVATAVKTFGRLDCAFNNAGTLPVGAAIADTEETSFDRTIAVDLKGVFLCLKYEIRQMLQSGGGAIVNNASIAGMIADPGIGPYVAAKHGVIGLTKTAALEYAKHNIRVNALAPGLVDTPMTKAWFDDPGIRAVLLANSPLGRPARPEEMAGMVLFLCSEMASFATGAVFPIDGAYTAR